MDELIEQARAFTAQSVLGKPTARELDKAILLLRKIVESADRDAQRMAVCDRCGRVTKVPSQFGNVCRLSRPNSTYSSTVCTGRMVVQ